MSKKEQILALLKRSAPLSASEVAHQLGLTAPQARLTLRAMVSEGEIQEVSELGSLTRYSVEGAVPVQQDPPPEPVAAPVKPRPDLRARRPALTVEQLMQKAREEEERSTRREGRVNLTIQYAPVAETLRQKHFTWKAIAAWMNERGVPVGMSNLMKAHRLWKAQQGAAA